MSTEKRPKKSSSGIKKQEFSLSNFKKESGLDTTVKDKELEWIPFSQAFHDATGLPGIPKGYVSLSRGFSNTGKSTSIYEAVTSCQKLGILPIIIDTENNWSWDHARIIGIEFEEKVDENGEVVDYDGFFIYMNNKSLHAKYGKFNHDEGAYKQKDFRRNACIEDIALLMEDLLDAQQKEDLPYELCFLWDSVGTIDCYRSVIAKTKNNMWNAGALETAFKGLLNNDIPSSRKEDSKYTNTFLAVQKIWIDNMNGGGVKHKGGEALFYSARLGIQFGGVAGHGTEVLRAAKGDKKYSFGIQTSVKIFKNQINGITYEGKICSVPHGFWSPDKLNEYKDKYRNYLIEGLGTEYGDFSIEREAVSNDESGMYEEG